MCIKLENLSLAKLVKTSSNITISHFIDYPWHKKKHKYANFFIRGMAFRETFDASVRAAIITAPSLSLAIAVTVETRRPRTVGAPFPARPFQI